jgi:hypothetical protein
MVGKVSPPAPIGNLTKGKKVKHGQAKSTSNASNGSSEAE